MRRTGSAVGTYLALEPVALDPAGGEGQHPFVEIQWLDVGLLRALQPLKLAAVDALHRITHSCAVAITPIYAPALGRCGA